MSRDRALEPRFSQVFLPLLSVVKGGKDRGEQLGPHASAVPQNQGKFIRSPFQWVRLPPPQAAAI